MEYWNHNTAYYGWVKKNTLGCKDILDVGCGDGSLVRFLDDGKRKVCGIDVDRDCVKRAVGASGGRFVCGQFETYEFERKFDAVIFSASIHHMDMEKAIIKAKSILKTGGVILIVGPAKPSTAFDWTIEGMRVIPCAVMSKIRHMKSSEENNVPVSYKLPKMNEVRVIAGRMMPHCKIRYGLYYRYLLKWRM